jgi:hypothetical protein
MAVRLAQPITLQLPGDPLTERQGACTRDTLPSNLSPLCETGFSDVRVAPQQDGAVS